MKAFLEEYGVAIVAVIIVAMLIFVASAIGGNAKGRLFMMYNRFINTADPCNCNHANCSGAGCTAPDCVNANCTCTL